jgi:hypothetical protein|tara:strand:+ start:553 stop:1326 length:774 start_codon:yes stop_codon:yes gene_type:complete
MSRLNQKDLQILQTGLDIDFNSPEYSYLDGAFGENPNDYIEVLIHDEQENFLESGIVEKENYEIRPLGVKLKTGTILRKFGYDRGRYVVKYNFFRKTAGSYENLLVDENQIPFSGESNINEQTGKITDENGRELFIKENKYLIHEISPSRTELRLTAQNIRGRQYVSEFFNLQRGKKVISSMLGNEFVRDPAQFFVPEGGTEELTNTNKIKLSIPTTTNMVGGYIYFNNAYVGEVKEIEEITDDDLLGEEYLDYQGS